MSRVSRRSSVFGCLLVRPVHLYLRPCVSVSPFAYLYLRPCVCSSVCASVFMSLCVCLAACASACPSLFVFRSGCASVFTSFCVWMCLSVCVLWSAGRSGPAGADISVICLSFPGRRPSSLLAASVGWRSEPR